MSPRALAGRAAELQTEALPKLADLQLVGLGAVPHRFLAPGERLGDGAHAHALASQRVQLLDLVLPPRLPVPLELLAAHNPPPVFWGRGTTAGGGGALPRSKRQ